MGMHKSRCVLVCYPCSFEGRISLYCLALQDVQQLCSQLQEEKFLVSYSHFSFTQ